MHNFGNLRGISYFMKKMAVNPLHQQYLTLQEALDDVVSSKGGEEKDIVILSPAQGDVYATDVKEGDADVYHKNDSLPNDVAGTLELHDVSDNSSDVMTNQSRTKDMQPPKKKKKTSEQVSWKKKTNLKEIPAADIIHLAKSHPHLAMLEPSEFFRLSFNDEICSFIVTQTERYASQRKETIQLTR